MGNETKKKSMRVISKSFFFLWASTETEAPSSSSLLSYALLLDSEPLSGPRAIGFEWRKAHRDQELDLKPAVLKDSATPLPEQEILLLYPIKTPAGHSVNSDIRETGFLHLSGELLR